jgi:hypothetical protein
MGLSLLVTATGTARFVASMGYDIRIGYAFGAIFDLAKGILPVAVLRLLARRALGSTVVLGAAWACLVAYSGLATNATVVTAIASIERTGTWKAEVRADAKTELANVEQLLKGLSRPAPPRPAKTVREALATERVPPGVWQDSQECSRIQESTHFAKACAQFVQLRRELAAAQDYERLFARASELRRNLAVAPIIATSDPLPAAFAATLGRVLPLSGTEGVATLVTMVVELVSCFGLAGLTALSNGRGTTIGPSREIQHYAAGVRRDTAANSLPLAQRPEIAQIHRFPVIHEPSLVCPPTPSEGTPKSAQASAGQAFGRAPEQSRRQDLGRSRGQTRHGHTQLGRAARLAHGSAQGSADHQAAEKAVREFVASLERGKDARATGSELASAYGTQRALRGWPDLQKNVFGAHLKSAVAAIGGRKIKSGSQVYLGVRVPAVASGIRL